MTVYLIFVRAIISFAPIFKFQEEVKSGLFGNQVYGFFNKWRARKDLRIMAPPLLQRLARDRHSHRSKQRVTTTSLESKPKLVTRAVAEMKNELSRIRTWSEILDESNMEVKKMMTSYIIKRVNVFKYYQLDIELNMDIQQFLNVIDNITEEKAATVASDSNTHSQ